MLLVGLILSLYGFLSLRSRRVEVTADLERQTRLFGSALAVSLEAALQDGLFEDTRGLIQRMQEAEQSIDVVYLDLIHPVDNAAFGRARAKGAGETPAAALPADAGSDVDGGADTAYRRPTPDTTREERLRRVQITGQPHGEHTVVDGREVFAYMFALHGSQHQLVAAVDLIRDKSDLEQAMTRTTRETLLTLGSLFVLLALLVGLSVRQELTGPLLRLVGGTSRFVRGPFVVEGVLQGVLGTGLALAGLWLAFELVHPFLEQGLALMFAAGSIRFFSPLELGLALAFGGLLGLLGARAAVAHYAEA